MPGARDQLPDVGGTVPVVPGYRIERQLGRGSMGVVYLAEDIQLRRKVALKVLAPTLADDELFRRRFDRESQSAANLDHPNIIPVYAAGEAGGSLYIAMRYVGGGDLRALLEANGPLSLEQAASVIAPIADALDAAHAQGMIHRDVKPANILIDGRNGQEYYYLSDFGITKIVSSGRSLTSTGQIVGTIDYIAPEQIQGKPLDGRADLYALGCVLYQCLAGVVPFPRDETAALMWAHVHEEAPPVTSRRPDLPPQIDRIVAKAMAKQPEDRYASCRELALVLRAVAADPAAACGTGTVLPAPPPVRPVDGPPPPRVPAGMTSAYTPPTPPPVRAAKTTSPPGRRWWLLATCGVVALAVIAGSTAAILDYFGSRFPNEAEQALLGYVPLALTMEEDSCNRNPDAQQGTANVQASVACTSDDKANTIVFTKFTTPQSVDQRYQAAVAAAGIGMGQSSGDCLSAQQAEGTYRSESGRTSGRALCYQQRGSSFITWTDDQSQILASATRVDTDYAKLREWWAGVVGLKLPAPKSSQESPPPPPPVAARIPPPAAAPAPRPAPEADPVEPPARAEADRGQGEESGEQGEKSGGGQGEESGEQGGESGEQTEQPTESPTTPPSNSTTTPPPSHSTVNLEGPAPAAPGAQQGGPPVPGTGGCTAIDESSGRVKISNFYACTVTEAAPAYLPGTTKPRGSLPAKQAPFLCQAEGSKYSIKDRAHHWWAWAGFRGAGVWVPVAFLEGAPDDASVPGLPVCGSKPTTTETSPTTAAGSEGATTETSPTESADRAPTTTETSPTESADSEQENTERYPKESTEDSDAG